jgi:hypothetical protein
MDPLPERYRLKAEPPLESAEADAAQDLRIGWREWVGLPELNVASIKAKIDTGARTSALHAWKIEPFRRRGGLWLRFELHPTQRTHANRVACEARAVDERPVRNSGGQVERRYVIETLLRLGSLSWTIELTLADRDQMGFRMLLGRTALKDKILIDPGRSYLTSHDKSPRRRRKALYGAPTRRD